jgi:hypothetical protein
MRQAERLMSRRTRSRLVWIAAALVAVVAFFYFSEAAMSWLRVTLHGR